MSIRLSGAQVTRITESILRLHYRNRDTFYHWEIEDFIEDILREVVPPPLYQIKENGEICLVPSEHQTPNEQRSVNI